MDLQIKFYDAITDGNLIFAEEHPRVELDNGVYSIQIGMGNKPESEDLTGGIPTELSTKSELWLEQVVNDEILAPRIMIGSTLFALKSEIAEKLATPGGESNALIVTSEGHILTADPLVIGGGDHGVPGVGSTSVGFNTKAVGQASVALGKDAEAAESSSIALGHFAEAGISFYRDWFRCFCPEYFCCCRTRKFSEHCFRRCGWKPSNDD